MCKFLFSLFLLFSPMLYSIAGSTIRVVQVSDVQLGFTEAHAKETGKIAETGLDDKYFMKAVELINNLQPAANLVVNTGDMVNDPANEELWQQYKTISQRLNPPVYEVMGNHDGWSEKGIQDYRKHTGRNDFYTFTLKNCRFIVLNSWYLKEPEKNSGAASEQKKFLEKVLRKDRSAFRVIMLHHPVFIERPDENDAYFNLPLKERQWLLDLAVKYKVKLILSGHSHRNIIKTYRDSVTLITTGPVSEPLGLNDDQTPSKRGFRIIDIDPETGTFTHEYITLPQAEKKETANSFSFIFLGDLHFDKPGHHDMDWVLRTHPADTSQIRHYCFTTKYHLPVLYNEIGAITRKDASFVVQTGDFTEGLCGNYRLAALQLNEFVHYTENMIHVPFMVSKGNHDITGPGADSAYKEVILPFVSRQSGNKITSSRYVYLKDEAVFFFYDSYDRTSLPWLASQMKKYADIPLKFVVMHEPVVPINARSEWVEFSRPEEKKDHDDLLELLGDNRAIVLAGHLHAYGIIERETSHGRFVQLSGSSVLDNTEQVPGKALSGVENYGPSLTELEPGFSPSDRERRKEKLSKEKPYVRHFEYGDIQGYILIHVAGNKVTADIYSGTGLKRWKTVDITSLLSN
ncbi:MAG TPA: metallophosphoesterase [Bacteroidales bacterium]|nr:metallophosphoesterase [Bacteroidales bacterium]